VSEKPWIARAAQDAAASKHAECTLTVKAAQDAARAEHYGLAFPGALETQIHAETIRGATELTLGAWPLGSPVLEQSWKTCAIQIAQSLKQSCPTGWSPRSAVDEAIAVAKAQAESDLTIASKSRQRELQWKVLAKEMGEPPLELQQRYVHPEQARESIRAHRMQQRQRLGLAVFAGALGLGAALLALGRGESVRTGIGVGVLTAGAGWIFAPVLTACRSEIAEGISLLRDGLTLSRIAES